MNAATLFAECGFRYPDNLLMAFIGGSQLHGAKVDGTDDTDYFGVFAEPKEKVLGLDKEEHFVHSTGDGKGNGPADVDITLYSLGKFARLAAKGNPSILNFLFAPTILEHPAWSFIKSSRNLFLAKSHVNQYLGYANAQLERLNKGRGQKNVHRIALEEKYGFDTKYAMHIIRLLDEAIELMDTGKIAFPLRNKEFLVRIRNGEVPLSWVTTLAESNIISARSASEGSSLPNCVDRDAISRLLVETYEFFWDTTRS